MLSSGSGSTPSLIPTHWNIGILLHKQTKLRKYMQHSVCKGLAHLLDCAVVLNGLA